MIGGPRSPEDSRCQRCFPTDLLFVCLNSPSDSGQCGTFTAGFEIVGEYCSQSIFYAYFIGTEQERRWRVWNFLLCLLAGVWCMTCDRAFNEVFCQLAFIKHNRRFCVWLVCRRLNHRPSPKLVCKHTHTHTQTKRCKSMKINALRKMSLFFCFLRYYRNIFTATSDAPKIFQMARIVQTPHPAYSNWHLLFAHTHTQTRGCPYGNNTLPAVTLY